MLGVAFLKFLNPSGGINQFLLSGEKWMAGRTDFHNHLFIYRTQLNRIATTTNGSDFVVFRMYVAFHN